MSIHTVLITGGAGYIGSHTAYYLYNKGYTVISLDLASQEHIKKWAKTVQGDFSDTQLLEKLFTSFSIDVVIHCAGLINVQDSIKNPLAYYTVNIAKTVQLLACMRKHSINNFVFSSSAAVYGEPKTEIINEEHPHQPINPYGTSKSIVEAILKESNFNGIALRYFNVAGTIVESGLKEQHAPETHVIPLLINCYLAGQPFTLFGTNYSTHDGTAIRDYIHVQDVAAAHYRALKYLEKFTGFSAFNIASGTGLSLRELINTVEQITHKKLEVKEQNARSGDPAMLIANIEKARTLLQWQPKNSALETIITSALISKQL